MIPKILYACLLLMALSCKKPSQNQNNNNGTADLSQIIKEKDIEQLNYLDFTVDDRVRPIIETSEPFNQLEAIIENTKKGDLSYFKVDGKKNIKSLITGLRGSMPDTLNTPAVLARIRVVETKLFKTESLANLSTTKKQDLLETLKELLVSFSNLNFQLNKKIENDSQNIERPI